ncbi:MAG TPA: trypsin-like peptidase domain-containing protein [Rhodanobacteraceae bacterium]
MKAIVAGVVLRGWLGLALACVALPAVHAATLNPALLPKVDAATFEVVAAKPTHDPLTYAKPLPLDLLPYQQRHDKYYSIGTAFAIGPNRYVTAGHVLLSGLGSLWGPPSLRDANGHVYAIDKIEKFSLRKDFVVFSLKHPPKTAVVLPVDRHPVLNQTVYAVGNALGTGVVIRNGLYTSDTPEQQDGAWKWMRFSAPASPGNSGGPLLDKDGKVIGVVLMKSPNENLNYALPISQIIDAPDNEAIINRRVQYGFDLIQDTRTDVFKASFKLPMSQAAFYAKFLNLRHADEDRQLKALLAENATTLFPRGNGAENILYESALDGSLFPELAVRASNGDWTLTSGRTVEADLDDNGYVRLGNLGGTILFHVNKPDDVPMAKLRKDPAELMDLMAQAGFMERRIGTVKDNITSLGKPTLDTTFADHWHRRWRIREWPVPYSNHAVIVLDLPVPTGSVGIMRWVPAGREHDFRINLEAMTNFFSTTYRGSLADWKAFFKQTKPLPDAFKHIHLDIRYGHHLSYKSQRVAFTVTSKEQGINPDDLLRLSFRFVHDNRAAHGKVAWVVAEVTLDERGTANSVVVHRHLDSTHSPEDTDVQQWEKVLHRRHPYDEVVRNEDDVEKIVGVASSAKDSKPSVLYSVDYYVDGTRSQAYMQSGLDALMKTVHVYER